MEKDGLISRSPKPRRRSQHHRLTTGGRRPNMAQRLVTGNPARSNKFEHDDLTLKRREAPA